jgi:hypothetical protein
MGDLLGCQGAAATAELTQGDVQLSQPKDLHVGVPRQPPWPRSGRSPPG